MENNKKKLESLQRIMSQAVEISSNSIIDVFVDFASHVQLLTVKVYLNGWDIENEVDYRKEVWFNVYDIEKCLEDLEEIIKYLGEVKNNEINSL